MTQRNKLYGLKKRGSYDSKKQTIQTKKMKMCSIRCTRVNVLVCLGLNVRI